MRKERNKESCRSRAAPAEEPATIPAARRPGNPRSDRPPDQNLRPRRVKATRWDATKYLNLWACSLSGGVLGYAQFPGGSTATDGVVILNSAFGNTATGPYNKGRTATHEVGHWLNLRHIWGDDGGACTGSDLVSDTPNQGAENYGCPLATKASCSNGGDMFMNYMDYTDDACMFMFSAGQKARMQATVVSGGAHYSITTSGKCN